jgi:hypothetical protein
MLLRFLRRPLPEQRLLVRTLAWTLLYSVWLRISSARRAAAALRATPPGTTSAPGGPTVAQIVWAVTAVAAHVPGTACLAQSLVGRRLLLSAGYPAQIRLGVRNEGTLEAHAWLEMDGKVLLPTSDSELTYAELPLEASSRSHV